MPKVAEFSDGERAAKCHLLASVCFDVLFFMEPLQRNREGSKGSISCTNTHLVPMARVQFDGKFWNSMLSAIAQSRSV
jgi:hypothetical protein